MELTISSNSKKQLVVNKPYLQGRLFNRRASLLLLKKFLITYIYQNFRVRSASTLQILPSLKYDQMHTLRCSACAFFPHGTHVGPLGDLFIRIILMPALSTPIGTF